MTIKPTTQRTFPSSLHQGLRNLRRGAVAVATTVATAATALAPSPALSKPVDSVALQKNAYDNCRNFFHNREKDEIIWVCEGDEIKFIPEEGEDVLDDVTVDSIIHHQEIIGTTREGSGIRFPVYEVINSPSGVPLPRNPEEE